MFTAEINRLDKEGLFPVLKGQEPESEHFDAIRQRMWVLEHPYAGTLDTTIMYGKWVGDATHFQYIDYDINNWYWLPDAKYHPGDPIVKYRWGPSAGEVDIFIFRGEAKGVVLNANPPVMGGQINNMWLLGTDPNKYAHWNKGAGRPDIGAPERWRFVHHGWTEEEGWEYGYWEAWKDYPLHTNPYEQIPHIKSSIGTQARHYPVEKDRSDISQELWTVWKRKYQDTFIGTEPDITWWYHHFSPDIISEYVKGQSEPMDSLQVGPDWRDHKHNLSYQDRIQHLIEHNYGYVTPVDDFWKKNWQYWHYYGIEIDQDFIIAGCPNKHPNYVNGAGVWVEYNPPYGMYSEGNSVLHLSDGYFYRCIQDMPYASREPGVHPDWEDFWIKDTLWQPNHIFTDPYYVQYSDYLHRCNSSAFEKVLKDIGKYDWYWDPNGTVPWWMYQNHYYYLTLEMAEPGVGYGPLAFTKHPLPRGCWRRIWRYTQSWDERRDPNTGEFIRTQKSRFGKEIDIDGKQVSMMWPGEYGNPPGYDNDILRYFSYDGGIHYNMWYFRHVITQQQYDMIEQPSGWEWQYTQYYCVVDVEELFRQAYKANPNIERKIAERHDPITTQWTRKLNKATDLMEDVEEPIFELYANLVNDMKDAIAELKYLRKSSTQTVTQLYTYTNTNQYSSGLEAYAKRNNLELYAEYSKGATPFNVGKHGFVCYYSEAHIQHGPWDVTLPANCTYKSYGSIKIKTADYDFPASFGGYAMVRVKYRKYCHVYGAPYIIEDMPIGFNEIILTDPRANPYDAYPLPWLTAYVPLSMELFEWVYNATSQVWEYQIECITKHLGDWPPEEYFDRVYADHDWWIWSKIMEMGFAVDEDLIFCLDFDEYLLSVFEQDPTNLIEV